jgi:hypothetical protein
MMTCEANNNVKKRDLGPMKVQAKKIKLSLRERSQQKNIKKGR